MEDTIDGWTDPHPGPFPVPRMGWRTRPGWAVGRPAAPVFPNNVDDIAADRRKTARQPDQAVEDLHQHPPELAEVISWRASLEGRRAEHPPDETGASSRSKYPSLSRKLLLKQWLITMACSRPGRIAIQASGSGPGEEGPGNLNWPVGKRQGGQTFPKLIPGMPPGSSRDKRPGSAMQSRTAVRSHLGLPRSAGWTDRVSRQPANHHDSTWGSEIEDDERLAEFPGNPAFSDERPCRPGRPAGSGPGQAR